MGLATLIAGAEQQDREKAWARLRELLFVDAPTKAQTDEARKIVTALGVTPEQIAKYESVIQQAKSGLATLGRGKGLSERIQKMQERVLASYEAMEKKITQARAEHQRLANELDGLGGEHANAVEAFRALERLQQDNPELLGDLQLVRPE